MSTILRPHHNYPDNLPFIKTILILLSIIGPIIGGSIYFSMKYIPTGHFRVAIIDGEKLKQEGKPFEIVRHLIEKEVEKVRAEFLPHSESLEAAFNAIKMEKNPAKAQKKKQAFDIKRAEIEKIFAQKQEYLHKINEYLSNLLNETVLNITQEIAKNKKIHIIHNRHIDDKLLIFYNDPVLDVTDEVISILNERLEKITLPLELMKIK